MDGLLILEILRALGRHGVAYKVVGGVAVNMVGIRRGTEDLDIFVDPSDDNIDALRCALREVFDDDNIDEIRGSDLRGEYPAIQYVPPVRGFHIDILYRLGEAFTWEDVEVESRVFEGLTVPVATPRMLYRMKRDTVRPRDRSDELVLRQLFDVED